MIPESNLHQEIISRNTKQFLTEKQNEHFFTAMQHSFPQPWGNRGRNRLLGQEVLMRWHPPQGADAMRAGTAQRE
jgi:hypothetical protein